MSFFITLEGPEGGGKTTHAEFLAGRLRAHGCDVLLSREPGGSIIGDQVRRILTSLDNTSMHPKTEFLLFSASRAQHVHEVILPHLEGGGVVISDRYFHSSLAYQGYGHQLNLDTLELITQFATGGLLPDLILLLDLPVEEGLERKRKKGEWNRLDAYQKEFHQRVRQGYLDMAKADRERWVVIDAVPSEEEIQEEIWKIVLQRLE
jgi:dTMP kinase